MEIPVQRNLNYSLQNAINGFNRKRVLTLKDVALLIRRSTHTARRALKLLNAFTSYNKNARYYTLPEIPQFSETGLWYWKDVYFSRFGTLKNTIIELVQRSVAGLNSTEIGNLVKIDPRTFLSAFATRSGLIREKIQGSFVYFSSDPTVRSAQRQQRVNTEILNKMPSQAESIAILVEVIKNPSQSTNNLCIKLRRQNYHVTPAMVESLFAHHRLSVKKKPPFHY